MTTRIIPQSGKFRDVFQKNVTKQKITSWFPGHMYKGLLQMQSKLATTDCIIEVHDARIPLSGRNPDFYNKFYAIKPHILVLNKMDLADMSHQKTIEKQLMKMRAPNVVFTNCKVNKDSNVEKILPLAIELMQSSEKYARAYESECKLMVLGVPNVGKSSLINRLRNIHLNKKKANPVGAKPGITQSVMFKVKIHEDPPVYLLDTPGIMQPKLNDLETGLRLALCSTLHDHLVGEVLIADYLLYWLNKHNNFSYVDYLQIPKPEDDVRYLLLNICKVLNKTQVIRNTEGALMTIPNWIACANHFIRAFRSGEFGRICLDDDLLK